MKKTLIALVIMGGLILSGCGTTSKTTIVFDGLQIGIPADYVAINSSQIDGYQIINKILKAYKVGTKTLIIARSALSASISPEEYAKTSKEKLAQGIPGYEMIDDSSISFDCGKEKVQGYTHSFSVTDSATDNPGKTYIKQYYFIAQGTPYIISQADRSNSHYSDFTSMVNSLHCSS